ncbi:MAG: hypothetical protein CMI01_00950 [Oceanospirillaceae bacterium]|nr:hypothetical protein [Oceanospirillaceae bacterium]
MSVVEGSRLPQVALAFMNEDHARAESLLQRLEAMIANAATDRESREEIGRLLAALYEHCQQHFAHEEREMERVNFPALACHQGEHARVIAQMDQACRQWRAAGDVGHLYEYLSILPDWLRNHVATMDHVTAEFVSRHDEVS